MHLIKLTVGILEKILMSLIKSKVIRRFFMSMKLSKDIIKVFNEFKIYRN
jgi:hypothetical protein